MPFVSENSSGLHLAHALIFLTYPLNEARNIFESSVESF